MFDEDLNESWYSSERDEGAQIRAVRLNALCRVYEQADRVLTGDPVLVHVASDGPAPAWSDGARPWPPTPRTCRSAVLRPGLPADVSSQSYRSRHHPECEDRIHSITDFPRGRWVLDGLPSPPARWTTYLQQQEVASLMAFSTASRVSPVRF